MAWTARLVHIGNLDAHDLADKLSVPAPVSALDWPELHLNAVVALPDEQPVVLLHVDWPAHPPASFIEGLGLTTVDILGHSIGGEIAQLIALDRPDLVRRLVLVGTGPRGGDAIARQAPEVAPLFTRRDELGEDMWLPIMFSPSKESQAAGRAFVSRITARADDRDVPVSDQTIAAYREAARGWASAPAGNFGYLDGIVQPALVVNGSNDIVIPTINSYHLSSACPTPS